LPAHKVCSGAHTLKDTRGVKQLSGRTKTLDELELFFAESLDLQCIAGIDGYFRRLNPAWTICLGWSSDELMAAPFLEFVHPDDRGNTLAELRTLAASVATIRFENRYRHRDGSYRWLQWNARTVPGGERIYATARDVTGEKRLQRQILEIGDHERERLGRELHDGLCQTLAGIAALSTTLGRSLSGRSARAASARAAEITTLLNAAISQTRDLARGLSPVGLAGGGLDGALAALAEGIEHQFRVWCRFSGDRPFPRLRHETEAHLFRIAQEAVQNAVSHGRPWRIAICLRCRDGKGRLIVRDDGVGISDKACPGLGLHTMSYRARLIGGSLDVGRRVPRGTTVTCAFPLS